VPVSPSSPYTCVIVPSQAVGVRLMSVNVISARSNYVALRRVYVRRRSNSCIFINPCTLYCFSAVLPTSDTAVPAMTHKNCMRAAHLHVICVSLRYVGRDLSYNISGLGPPQLRAAIANNDTFFVLLSSLSGLGSHQNFWVGQIPPSTSPLPSPLPFLPLSRFLPSP